MHTNAKAKNAISVNDGIITSHHEHGIHPHTLKIMNNVWTIPVITQIALSNGVSFSFPS